MRSSIPKENPASAEVLGLVVDAALQTWLAHCETEGTSFEELTASSTPQSAAVLASRGFSELEDSAIDFAALGRGEAIASHRARLPAAVVAFERRAQGCEDLLDRAMAQELLDAMRAQPGPAAAADDDEAAPPLAEKPKADPWSGIKGFGF